MHILFLSHYFPPEVNAPATRTLAHCRRWVELGHAVTVITCAPSFPQGVVFPGYRNAWCTEERVEGIRVLRVATLLAANRGFLRRIASFLSYMLMATLCASRLRGVDVVVATSPQFFCGWAGVLCKWLRGWPFILEIRDIWPESILAVGAMKQSPAIRLLEWLERRMYQAADHIITVGDGYKRKLLERRVPESRITVVPNGVDEAPPVSPHEVQKLREAHQARDKQVCSYIGTLGPAHALDVVIDAATELQERGQHHIQFWLVGDGAQRERLERMARERNLRNVVFTGLVSKDLAATYLAASDACLVHLRGTELFQTVIPSKLFEMLAANKPIVIGVGGEARRMVAEAAAGIAMTPESPESLIEAVQAVLANPARYQNGRRYVMQRFRRDELAQKMLNVLVQHVQPRSVPMAAPPRPATENDSARRRAA